MFYLEVQDFLFFNLFVHAKTGMYGVTSRSEIHTGGQKFEVTYKISNYFGERLPKSPLYSIFFLDLIRDRYYI